MSSNNSSKALKAGLWYTVSNIVLKTVGVFTAPIFTRLLTPADYGKINNYFSWQIILACVFGLCLNYSIGRAKIDYKEKFNDFISSIQTLSLLAGVSILIIILPFLDYLASFMEMDKGVLISLMVLLIVSPSLDYMQSKFRFEYRYKENVAIALVNTLSIVSISICLILLSDSENKYIARIMGSVIPTFCLGTFSIIHIYKEGKKYINREYWKYALSFSLPMIPHGLAMVLLAQIDRIMLIKMANDEAAGLYSFGYSYAIIISIFTNAVMNAWQPWLYDKINDEKYEDIKKTNKEINLLIFCLTLCFILLGPEVIMILGSPAFFDAKWMVAPIITGCFFQFFYGYFSLMEIFCKKTEIIAYGSIVAAIVKIGLNIIFIPIYGYVGAAYTTMLGYGLLLLYHWIMFKHIFKKKIFAEKQMLILVLIASILTIVLVNLYEMTLLRYTILILLIGSTTLVYRKNLMCIIKTTK